MSETALAAFQSGENHLRAGKYHEALQDYVKVMRGVPEFLRARLRIADVLLNLKAPHQALVVYKAVAWHALKAGHPLDALVAIKMASAMDRSQLEVVEVMADLYCRGSERLQADAPEPTRRSILPNDQAAQTADLSAENMLEVACREAADFEAISNYPNTLPTVPLFSFLEEEAFVQVLASLQLRRFVQGNALLKEGEPGDSFFILAEGDVQVSRQVGDKPVNLARLRHGAVFGEMALITNAPRTATVSALNDVDALELKRSALQDQAHKLASITQALKEFTQERFLNNLTSTSPLFKRFPRSIRTEVIKKFQDFPVDPGDELIAEGEPGQGLFLILKGQVQVSKQDDGAAVELATLKEGDVFGEISLLQDSSTTATCTAKTKGELLFLPRREFHSTMARHPELKDELAKLTADRLQKTKDLMDTEYIELIEDDDLIML